MDAWLHVLDAVVELPAHPLREGGGEGLEAVVHHPHHHRVPGGQGRHGAFVGLRGEGAAARVDGGVGVRCSSGREEEEEEEHKERRHGRDGARGERKGGDGRETG